MPVSLVHLLLWFNSTVGFCWWYQGGQISALPAQTPQRWVPCPQDWQHYVSCSWPCWTCCGRVPKVGCISLPRCFSPWGRDGFLHTRRLLALFEERRWLVGALRGASRMEARCTGSIWRAAWWLCWDGSLLPLQWLLPPCNFIGQKSPQPSHEKVSEKQSGTELIMPVPPVR